MMLEGTATRGVLMSAKDPSRMEDEERYMAELGRRIRILRERRDLTQQHLARLSGIAPDMVSRIENGHYRSPGLRTLLRIADGLDIPLCELFPGPTSDDPSSARGRLLTLIEALDPDELQLATQLIATVLAHHKTR